jgi:DNA replication and repair protein RecF
LTLVAAQVLHTIKRNIPLLGPKAVALAVMKLTVSNFRSYEGMRLETDGMSVVLTGKNGAGKTNLLEAISFLSPGRGLRNASLVDPSSRTQTADLAQKPCEWAVAAVLNSDGDSLDVGTGIVFSTSNDGRRVVQINGVRMRNQSSLAERISILWFTPDMQRLFTDGATGRRRFLDRMVAANNAGHISHLQTYERALRDRARILSDARQRAVKPDGDWLDPLEVTLAEKGIAIAAGRLDFVERLNAACALGVGPFPAAELSLSGCVDSWLNQMPAVDAEEKFIAILNARRNEDALTSGTTVGPHRTDLRVEYLARGVPAEQCSTGEQKALILSIILANSRLQVLDRGFAPILLLDEVTAHLDDLRREALFEEIAALGAQAWMTGVHPALFSSLSGCAKHFSVSESSLTTVPF